MTNSSAPAPQSRLWTGTFLAIMTIGLTSNVIHYMFMSTLPMFAASISGSAAAAGLMTTVYSLSALVFRPIFGNVMDAKGRLPVLFIGAVTLTAVSLSYSWAAVFAVLIVLRTVQGVAFSAQSTASGTVVADIVPQQRLSEGIGYFGISNTIAAAVGPALGLWIVESAGWGTMFRTAFGLGLMTIAVTFAIRYERKNTRRRTGADTAIADEARVDAAGTDVASSDVASSDDASADVASVDVAGTDVSRAGDATTDVAGRKPAKTPKPVLFDRDSLLPALVMFFVTFGISGISTFVPAFGAERGISHVSLFFVVNAAAVFLARIVSGRFADRHGFTAAYLPGVALVIVSLVVLAFAHTLQMMLVAAVIYGFGFGTVFPVVNTLIIRLCRPERRGAANATLYMAMDIGMGAGAALWGVIAQGFGFQSVYLVGAACVLISPVIHFALLRKRIATAA